MRIAVKAAVLLICAACLALAVDARLDADRTFDTGPPACMTTDPRERCR